MHASEKWRDAAADAFKFCFLSACRNTPEFRCPDRLKLGVIGSQIAQSHPLQSQDDVHSAAVNWWSKVPPQDAHRELERGPY